MPFFALALVSSSPWWCLLCIRYGLYKNETLVCPYLRLTAETKIAIPDGMSLGFKPPAFNSFLFILRNNIYFHGFELTVQSAFRIFLVSRLTF